MLIICLTICFLFEIFNNFHPKIKLTFESNPEKFLDTRLIYIYGIYNTIVNRKSTKLSIAWFSKVPKHSKLNAFIVDSYRSKRILMNFANEVKHIKIKSLQADYPLRFVDSIVTYNLQQMRKTCFMLHQVSFILVV